MKTLGARHRNLGLVLSSGALALSLSACGPIAPSVSKQSLNHVRSEVQPGATAAEPKTCTMEPVTHVFQYERRVVFVPESSEVSVERGIPENQGPDATRKPGKSPGGSKDKPGMTVVRIEGRKVAASSRDKGQPYQVELTFEKDIPSQAELRFELTAPAEGADNPYAESPDRFLDELETAMRQTGERKWTLTVQRNKTSEWAMERLRSISLSFRGK